MAIPSEEQGEGDSPLLWTMLYPPLEIARLKTYAWDGHLDNFLPWTVSNPDHATRPPLTSHAMWNLQKGSNSQKSWSIDMPHTSPHHLTKSLVTSTQHPVLGLQSKGSQWTKSASLAVYTPTTLPPAPLDTPKPNAIMSISFAKAAIMIYLFVALQSSHTWSTEKLIIPQITQYWRICQSGPIDIVKTRTSCYCWTTAIIQCTWIQPGTFSPTAMWKAALQGLASPKSSGLFISTYSFHTEPNSC